ncbi:hypothetical protein GF412_01395 [Candidatus Micrarchaeota archaeon]|nr:hypothetical protein [Candidatus Micrarchaeota archaeon]MBD3417624.1 hypothetical protein [Candidatus Micrarchaeota archaeon]
MRISLSTYPESIPAYPGKTIDLIVDANSSTENPSWLEAEITLESGLSLKPNRSVRAGRFRVGICEGRESCSKPIKIYTEHNVRSHLYKCHVSVFAFNKKGELNGRIDEHTLIKCDSK